MDIEIKYRIIAEVISSNDEEVLQAIQTLLGIKDGQDFWDDLSEADQNAIVEALEQLNSGKHVSHKSVREEIKSRFGF